MEADTSGLYNYFVSIINGTHSPLSDASLYENALALGVTSSGVKMLKALSDKAYNKGMPKLGGLLYEASSEAEKRLFALNDYMSIIKPKKAIRALEDWDRDSPVWAKTEDKEAALSHTFLYNEDINKIIIGEIYNVIYKKNWKLLFSEDTNISMIGSDKRYGWELRKACTEKTASQIFQAKWISAKDIAKEDKYLYINRNIRSISDVRSMGEYVLIYTDTLQSVELKATDKIVVLPNY